MSLKVDHDMRREQRGETPVVVTVELDGCGDTVLEALAEIENELLSELDAVRRRIAAERKKR